MKSPYPLCALLFAGFPATTTGGESDDRELEQLRVDACSLLTPSEIARVVEMPASDGASEDAGLEANGAYSATCYWSLGATGRARLPPGDGPGFVILHVMRWPNGTDRGGEYLQSFRDAARAGEIPSQPEPRDIGQEALWWGDGLAVRKGDTSFGVSIHLPDTRPASGPPGQREQELASNILRRLD